jgi:Mg2+/Co2+ transporter CorB
MNAVVHPAERSWFRTAAGLRVAAEVGVILAAKVAVLVLLYFVCIAPQPRADTSPASVRAHLLAADEAAVEPATP